MILNRIAYEKGNMGKEESCYKQATELSMKIQDLDVEKVLKTRRRSFPKIFSEADTLESEDDTKNGKCFKNFLLRLDSAIKDEYTSQDVFEEGLDLIKIFDNTKEGVNILMGFLTGVYQIMPRTGQNILDLARILSSIDFTLFDEEREDTFISFTWNVITNITFLTRPEDTIKLLKKVIKLTNIEDKKFRSSMLCLYWIIDSSEFLDMIKFAWTRNGLVVNYRIDEFIIPITEIKSNLSIILFSIISSDSLGKVIECTNNLENKFPNPYIIDEIGTICYQIDLSSIGKRILQNAVEKYPVNADLRLSIGRIFVGEKDYQNAETHYLKALEVIKDDLEAMSGLSTVYRLTGQIEKGKKYAEQIYTLLEKKDPRYRNSTLILAKFLLLEGENSEAIELIQSSIENWSDSITLNAALSFISASDGENLETVQKYCKKAIDIGNSTLQDLYSKFKVSRSQIKDALEHPDVIIEEYNSMNLYDLIVAFEDLYQLLEIKRYDPIINNITILLTTLLKRLKYFYQSLT